MAKNGLLTILLLLASASAAHAGQAGGAPPAAPTVDAEERLDDGLKRFGYLAGLTRNCIKDDQKAALDRETMDLHGSIARLLGTDRAYLFAASMGYGTSVKLDVKDCPDVLKAYDARVAKQRAAAGKAQ
jgi:hypothetical protein